MLNWGHSKQHAPYTRFLPRPARKESKAPNYRVAKDLLSNICSVIKGETSMETDSTDKDPLSKNEMTYLCAFCHFIFQTKSGYMEHTKLGNCVQVSFFTCLFGCIFNRSLL